MVSIVLFLIYQYDPTFFGLMGNAEGFYVENTGSPMNTSSDRNRAMPGPGSVNGTMNAQQNVSSHSVSAGNPPQVSGFQNMEKKKEGFEDLATYEGPANFGTAEGPAGCYPRDQLTPSELLPKDMNSIWAQQNPLGTGSLKGKNFLSAGALIGVNTVGQSLRNANLQLRSEPPNPQIPVSIFNQSTISPDISHRPLELGS
ncbi:MAG: hypothetical protein EB120_13295 [Proteobacteria bacterium]|nr:hypothetical protein [Pseudomonadota bacterium]